MLKKPSIQLCYVVKRASKKLKKNIDSFVNYFKVMLLTGVWFLCFFVLFACLLV